ncbi:endonuclease/exonuclease/phosphatase family protein [Nesterenkonia pannonica]|uniref:endonuclease/exonuclease/phosphatase family protein n=1 Tax=Nesterenkonia pannonica TaxID=1548602 RepID=UPI002164A012|nr:endonuclease/exonuclease/phosphatase family protein [Nesterenkonia pannonica]
MPEGFTAPARRFRGICAAAPLLPPSWPSPSRPLRRLIHRAYPEASFAAALTPLYPTPGQPASSEPGSEAEVTAVPNEDGDLRVATLHAGLTASNPEGSDPLDSLISDLAGGNHGQARTLAETVQINEPDVLVLTGVSHDEDGRIAEILQDQYFASGQNGQSSKHYPHVFTAPTNSGVDSGVDLDGDGTVGGSGDAMGYGSYPGQEGMIIFSKEPLDTDGARTFQEFLWKDMPGSSLSDEGFTQAEESILRLATTSLWDVPVLVEGHEPIHLIVSATAASDEPGTADRARSEDFAQLLADYVASEAWYLYDDEGVEGGLRPGAHAIVVGEPFIHEDAGAEKLTSHPALEDPEPEAVTDTDVSERPGEPSQTDETATRWVSGGEDLRASFAVPSTGLSFIQSGVFWPGDGEFGHRTVDPTASNALDDRLVWLDVHAPH